MDRQTIREWMVDFLFDGIDPHRRADFEAALAADATLAAEWAELRQADRLADYLTEHVAPAGQLDALATRIGAAVAADAIAWAPLTDDTVGDWMAEFAADGLDEAREPAFLDYLAGHPAAAAQWAAVCGGEALVTALPAPQDDRAALTSLATRIETAVAAEEAAVAAAPVVRRRTLRAWMAEFAADGVDAAREPAFRAALRRHPAEAEQWAEVEGGLAVLPAFPRAEISAEALDRLRDRIRRSVAAEPAVVAPLAFLWRHPIRWAAATAACAFLVAWPASHRAASTTPAAPSTPMAARPTRSTPEVTSQGQVTTPRPQAVAAPDYHHPAVPKPIPPEPKKKPLSRHGAPNATTKPRSGVIPPEALAGDTHFTNRERPTHLGTGPKKWQNAPSGAGQSGEPKARDDGASHAAPDKGAKDSTTPPSPRVDTSWP
jgi:GrpB-like predicted nucleotidyltransferase (UPF0157 family)